MNNLDQPQTERARTKSYYPWFIAAVGALLLMCLNIYANTFGVFFKPIAQEFGWSRGELSASITFRFAVAAILAIPMGYWADRYGPRRVLLPSFLLLGLGMIATTRVDALWQMFLVQGLVLGTATAAPFICISATVARWHQGRRGLALGIAAAGVGLSGMAFPPVAAKLIQVQDWRYAMVLLGLFTVAVTVPGGLLFKDPVDRSRRYAGNAARQGRQGPFQVWRLMPRVLKNPAFAATIVTLVLVFSSSGLVLNHLVNYATDIRIAALTAAAMMSALGIGNTFGRLAMGAVSDRIGTRTDMAICCLLLALPMVLLVTQVNWLMWIAVILFGVGAGGAIPLVPAIMGERLGTEHLSTATGIGTIGIFIGYALGPWMGGFLFDISGGYLWALVLGAVFSLAALVIIMWLPGKGHPVWEKAQTLLDS